MPLIKVQAKGQITIPKQIRDQLGIAEGDLVEIVVENGKGVIMSEQALVATPEPPPTAQRTLARAQKKIEAISKNRRNATGLTLEEADVAANAGLIDSDQKYWWLEDWQKGERQADQNDKEGNYTEYDSPEAFLKSLE